MNKTLKKIWNVFTWLLVAAVILLAVAMVGVRLIGLQAFTVLSGSMEPAYRVGSLIYVKDVDPFELESGDVITFMLDEDTVATHRIVLVVPDEDDPTDRRFSTKGDANEAVDGALVHYKNVLGTPVFSVPYLGYLANYISKPPGMYVAISVGAVLLALTFLPDVFTEPYRGKHERLPDHTPERNRRSRNSLWCKQPAGCLHKKIKNERKSKP